MEIGRKLRCRVPRCWVGPFCFVGGLLVAGCDTTQSEPRERSEPLVGMRGRLEPLVEMRGRGSEESEAFDATGPFKYCWEQEGTVPHVSVGVRRLNPSPDQPPAEATDAETLDSCSIPLVLTPPGRFRLTVAAADDVVWRAWAQSIE